MGNSDFFHLKLSEPNPLKINIQPFDLFLKYTINQ